LADEAAKEAALSLEAAMIDLTSVLQNPCKTPVFIPPGGRPTREAGHSSNLKREMFPPGW
jgi:hypothetical protein